MSMAQGFGVSSLPMLIVFADPLGQFFCGWISDRIARARLLIGLLLLECVLLVILPSASVSGGFVLLLFAILFASGGCFAIILAFTADCFGSDHFAAIFGLMQAVASIAIIFGPIVAAQLREGSESHAILSYVFAALLLAAAFLPLLIRPSRMISEAN